MRITHHCFALTGFGYLPPWSVNAGFIRGEKVTLIVDAGPHAQAAATLFGYASLASGGSELRLINTERHLDHMLGNCYFEDKRVPIYGHPDVRRTPSDLSSEIEEYQTALTDPVRRAAGEARLLFKGTRVCNPSRAIASDTRMDLGGIAAEIIMTPGHTDSNLSVFVAEEAVLYCGDCIVNGYLPNLGSGKVADWQRWLEALDRLESLKPRFIVPGHGPVISGQAIVTEIDRIRKILQSAVRSGRSRA